MDKVVQANIERYLQNVGIFYSIVKGHLEKGTPVEETLEILKTQHAMNEYLMVDLGFRFDHKAEIRTLSQQVRELEERLGQREGFNFESAAMFLSQKNDEFGKFIKQHGLHGSAHFEMCTAIGGKISLYGFDDEFSRGLDNYRDEAEYEAAKARHAEQLLTLKQNFDLIKSERRYDSNYVLFNEKNIAKITEICEEFFESDISNVSYELRNEEQGLYISEFKFTVLCTDSAKNLQRAFRNR